MQIHVVQPNDTIQSIADRYGIPVSKLILDNGLNDPKHLVTGQTIVIAKPEITHTVQAGDTLFSIAQCYNITLEQLMMNNPHLMDSKYIYPDEILVISYRKKGKMAVHGNTVAYINKNTLKKTLLYLTYLSVLNYTATKEGEIITYYDDTDIIRITKEYGVVPLMLLTTLTIHGEANIRIAYEILISEELQNRQIENVLKIIKDKGYSGINISFEYINPSNLKLYETYFAKIERRLKEEGYLVFITINTKISNATDFEKVDYSFLDELADHIIFMNYEWATNINPPSPIISIYNINEFLDYVNEYTALDHVIIGIPTIGYDWELPFSAGLSSVYSLTPQRAVDLAGVEGVDIQFDEKSQTPYYKYSKKKYENMIEHIVWFIDARSMNAIMDLVMKYKLQGTSVFNSTIYNPQLWVVINSQFDIEKVLD